MQLLHKIDIFGLKFHCQIVIDFHLKSNQIKFCLSNAQFDNKTSTQLHQFCVAIFWDEIRSTLIPSLRFICISFPCIYKLVYIRISYRLICSAVLCGMVCGVEWCGMNDSIQKRFGVLGCCIAKQPASHTHIQLIIIILMRVSLFLLSRESRVSHVKCASVYVIRFIWKRIYIWVSEHGMREQVWACACVCVRVSLH